MVLICGGGFFLAVVAAYLSVLSLLYFYGLVPLVDLLWFLSDLKVVGFSLMDDADLDYARDLLCSSSYLFEIET